MLRNLSRILSQQPTQQLQARAHLRGYIQIKPIWGARSGGGEHKAGTAYYTKGVGGPCTLHPPSAVGRVLLTRLHQSQAVQKESRDGFRPRVTLQHDRNCRRRIWWEKSEGEGEIAYTSFLGRPMWRPLPPTRLPRLEP